jgi:hypothetical protein
MRSEWAQVGALTPWAAMIAFFISGNPGLKFVPRNFPAPIATGQKALTTKDTKGHEGVGAFQQLNLRVPLCPLCFMVLA